MKRLRISPILLCLSLWLSGSAEAAVVLSLSPGIQNSGVGSTAMVDLSISGLGDFAAPSLGAFTIDITFDQGGFNLNSVVFDTFLGGPLDSSSFFDGSVLGEVRLDELSFLPEADLDALQPGTFRLATLSFIALAEGSHNLGFGDIELVNAASGPEFIEFDDLSAAVIEVGTAGLPVPEPPSISLFVTGLLSLIWMAQRRRPRL